MVANGRFRQDLYYRINVIELRVPPLRERLSDLPGLCAKILQRLAADLDRPAPALAPAAVDALGQYAFPGNVRELENILERAMAMADGDQLEVHDLRLPLPVAAPGASPTPMHGGMAPALAQPAAGGHPSQTPQAAAAAAGIDPRTVDPRDTATTALPSYIEEIE